MHTAMLTRHGVRAPLFVAIASLAIGSAGAQSPGTRSKATSAASTTAPAAAAQPASRRYGYHRPIRRQAAITAYRPCGYLGCPGYLILGIGF
jgi:hypothetical protein